MACKQASVNIIRITVYNGTTNDKERIDSRNDNTILQSGEILIIIESNTRILIAGISRELYSRVIHEYNIRWRL